MKLEHGQLSYLQIPAIDVERAATFYSLVLGWKVEHAHASFELPGLIGQWVTDRAPARDAGPIGWFHVTNMDTALALVRAHGGEVIAEPTADGPSRMLATVRDPAGNSVGLVQHTAR